LAAEGVSFVLDRWIAIGRLRLDRGEGVTGAQEDDSGAMAGLGRGRPSGRSRALGKELMAPGRSEARGELT